MGTEPAQRLFTVDEYEAMGKAGIFHPDDRLELIEGVIVEMSPIGDLHMATVNRSNRLLVRTFGDRALVRIHNPVRLRPRSEPQPDVAVYRPRPDDYAHESYGTVETFGLGETVTPLAFLDLPLAVDDILPPA